jgi:hypothetical protein
VNLDGVVLIAHFKFVPLNVVQMDIVTMVHAIANLDLLAFIVIYLLVHHLALETDNVL